MSLYEWCNKDQAIKLIASHEDIEMKGEDINHHLKNWLSETNMKLSGLQKMLSIEQRYFLGDHNLYYTDIMSMAASVEVRVPFLDEDMIRFSNIVPDEYKIKRNETKWLLKKAMEGCLPREIIYRSKTGFGSPIKKWVEGNMAMIIKEELSGKKIDTLGVFDSNEVQYLLDEHYTGRRDNSYTIWTIYAISVWLRVQNERIKINVDN